MYPQVLSVPFGFDLVQGKLVQNSHEQKLIAFMQLWRSQGDSYDTISERLNFSMNEPTKRDRVWHGTQINKILKREGNYDEK